MDSATVESESNAATPCRCNNTCSRKTTAKTTGCPCKTAKVHCTDLCTCGTKKKSCKNKAQNQGPVVALSPTPDRPTEEEERVLENRRVKEFISTLDEKTVRQLCVRALSRGVGSMEYVDSLLIMEDDEEDTDNDPGEGTASSGDQQPPHSEPIPDWCKCRLCQPMPQEIENKCCGLRKCVTLARHFQKLCLDPEVLELCIRNRADIRNDREDNSTSSFRKAAYRQFILEKYGYLGKGNRKVAPACVVLSVRRHYPSPTGIYMGFRPE